MRIVDCIKSLEQEKKKRETFLKTKIKVEETTDDNGIVTGRIVCGRFTCPPGEPYKSRGEVFTEFTVRIIVDFRSFSYVGGRNYLRLESKVGGFDCYSRAGDPKQLERFVLVSDFKAVSKWKNEHDLTMEEWILGLIKYSNLLVPTEQEKNKGKTRQQIIMEEKRKFQEEMRSSRIQRI